MPSSTKVAVVAGATVFSIAAFRVGQASVPAHSVPRARASVVRLRAREKGRVRATIVKRKATMEKVESSMARKAERELDRASTETARLTSRLRGDEMDALLAFAKARHWSPTTALRAILREKFLGEKIPF
jgi:hypothetical protein